MKRNGFTLIELLVVVAIIGILAAVGVVAYNGYTKSAKVSVIKSNHVTFVKKVGLINQDCNINGSVNLMKKWNDKTSYNIVCPNLIGAYSAQKILLFEDYLRNHINNLQFRNPIKPNGSTASQPGVCAGSYTDGYLGWVWISATKIDHITVCTCFKSPCGDSKNRLENKIYLD